MESHPIQHMLIEKTPRQLSIKSVFDFFVNLMNARYILEKLKNILLIVYLFCFEHIHTKKDCIELTPVFFLFCFKYILYKLRF